MLVTYLFLFTTRRKKKLATKINEGKNNNSLFTRFSDIKFFFANFKFFSSNFCHYTYVEDSPIENMFISWPNEKYTVFFFFGSRYQTCLYCVLHKVSASQYSLFASIFGAHGSVKHMLDDWKLAQDLRSNDNTHGTTVGLMPTIPNGIQWRRPASGRFKCNIDTSFSHSSNKLGI